MRCRGPMANCALLGKMIDMAMTMDDFFAEHPVDRGLVEEHKRRMLAEVGAFRLRELRQVSETELGDLDSD